MKLSKYVDVQIVPDDDHQPKNESDYHEEGVDVPYERITPEVLHNLIAEFVTKQYVLVFMALLFLPPSLSAETTQVTCLDSKVIVVADTKTITMRA